MPEPLYTETCTSTDDPCAAGGVWGFNRRCTREDYAGMWLLALALREAMVDAYTHNKIPAGEQSTVADWLRRWTTSANILDRGATLVSADPAVERRFPAPDDLGVLDADDLDVTALNLIFNESVDGVTSYVRDGNALAEASGVDSPALELARRRVCDSGLIDDLGELGNAAGGIAALLVVGGVLLVGVWLVLKG